MPEGKKLAPAGIFAFAQPDDTDGIIVIEHIMMVRWDGNVVRSLKVYFARGPHVSLDEKQGKELIEMMKALDNYRRNILAL